YTIRTHYAYKKIHTFTTRRSSDLKTEFGEEQVFTYEDIADKMHMGHDYFFDLEEKNKAWIGTKNAEPLFWEDKGEEKTDESTERSEEHTSELQSRFDLVCRLLLEK